MSAHRFLLVFGVVSVALTQAAVARCPNDSNLARARSLVNFRDVGGKVTVDGLRVRCGRVYRSAAFWATTPADAHFVREGLGIQTYIDLRSRQVGDSFPPTALLQAGVAWVRLPVTARQTDSAFYRTALPTAEAWAEHYLQTFASNAPTFVALLQRLAGETAPVAFSCTHGKDRSGMATALLLSLLGVDERTIVEDYAATTAALAPHAADYLRPSAAEQVAPWSDPTLALDLRIAHWMTARPEIMRRFLAGLRQRFGSVQAALEKQGGLTARELASLRDALLEGPPQPMPR